MTAFKLPLIGGAMLSTAAAVVLLAPSAPASAADPVKRPASFAVCSACHTTEKNGPNRIGPNLFGIGGRMAGTQPGFNYSSAMKTSKIKWDKPKLLAFLGKPQAVVPGTRMAFPGIQNKAKAEEVANYLIALR